MTEKHVPQDQPALFVEVSETELTAIEGGCCSYPSSNCYPGGGYSSGGCYPPPCYPQPYPPCGGGNYGYGHHHHGHHGY
jgi:hypothetical protein